MVVPMNATMISNLVNKKLMAALKKIFIKVSSNVSEQVEHYTDLILRKRGWSTSSKEIQSQWQRKGKEGSDGTMSPTSDREESSEEAETASSWAVKMEREIMKIVMTPFRYKNSSSYSDELLLIPCPIAI